MKTYEWHDPRDPFKGYREPLKPIPVVQDARVFLEESGLASLCPECTIHDLTEPIVQNVEEWEGKADIVISDNPVKMSDDDMRRGLDLDTPQGKARRFSLKNVPTPILKDSEAEKAWEALSWAFTPAGAKMLIQQAKWSALRVFAAKRKRTPAEYLAGGKTLDSLSLRNFPRFDAEEIAAAAVHRTMEKIAVGEVKEYSHAVGSTRLAAKYMALAEMRRTDNPRRWPNQVEFDTHGKTVGGDGLRALESRAQGIASRWDKASKTIAEESRAAAAVQVSDIVQRLVEVDNREHRYGRRTDSPSLVKTFTRHLAEGKSVAESGKAAGISRASAFRLMARLKEAARRTLRTAD